METAQRNFGTFLVGAELRGITQVRSGATTYPAVAALVDLAGDARSIPGSGAKLGHAADWSEYFGHHPQVGSGEVFFHLDPLRADAAIDFGAIGNYPPLADWRDGLEHLDAASWDAITELGDVHGNPEGGEGFDWYYTVAGGRSALRQRLRTATIHRIRKVATTDAGGIWCASANWRSALSARCQPSLGSSV